MIAKKIRTFRLRYKGRHDVLTSCSFSPRLDAGGSGFLIGTFRRREKHSSEFWANSREALLLLRVFLAGGILSFCFRQKRWRVYYGLDPSRRPATKLALPFRAKDSPTARSEFSHLEVVIELAWALKHLISLDHPDDRSTCEEEVFPHFRFTQTAINYYLSKDVFPKEMKEFPSKLSASGWDIGKIKTLPTTGFSGTNDSRAVLPLTVTQLDLPEQQHTNALVLEYLLQPENTVALMPSHVEQDVSVAKMLLGMVVSMEPPVRVILDVGAQVLELDVLGVAREWLSSFEDSDETEAAVFFNEDDELSVVDRKGRIELLQVSPYANHLNLCLVFLDQVHTRGTELKMPENYRAAVTLGANLTKDRLVQACMRMRLLGAGQSVVFCVPQEIISKIQQRLSDLEQSNRDSTISVSDILAWAVTETWNDSKHNIPLWAAQGRRNEKHQGLWSQCHDAGSVLTQELAKGFLEDEAQTLEERYRPLPGRDDVATALGFANDAIAQRCQLFNNAQMRSAALQEEQERELAPEIEQERQDERPPEAVPVMHTLHDDIRYFAAQGRILEGSSGSMNAFESLRRTSAASHFEISQFRPGLRVSADFARTVEIQNSKDELDAFQRSVQWILTASRTPNDDVEYMMVISPYEANELLPMIQESKAGCVALHLYAPRPNLGYQPLDELNLHTVPESLKDREIPRRLITELNLFAGQLYLDSFEEYLNVCKFLGLAREQAKEGEAIGADGFIHCDHTGWVGGKSGLSASPVLFFKILLTKIRRDCETIDKTHMGQILGNCLLAPDDFK
ncbi:hypothetical protein F4808DRAFT_447409 [Astrocystis sublimbata]|nr:hypothetical protein F4808DRAFT_447409 [Astrocystis sublimbata]